MSTNVFMSAEDLIEEIRDTLSKMKECEKIAFQRISEAQTWGKIDNKNHEFYQGEEIAYRNSAHYLENILKIAVGNG